MTSGRVVRLAMAAVALVSFGVLSTGTAGAACHAFEISVSPASVAEGGRVNATVTRDAGVNPSSIHVSSVDGSARAGEDYEAVDRTVSFATETSQTFPVATVDNGAPEGSETFRLHLSDPGGCAINPNFEVGPDATVTITDNDAAGTTTSPPTSGGTVPSTVITTTTTTAQTETTETTEAETTTTAEIPTSSIEDPTTTESSTTTSTLVTEEAAGAGDGDDDDDGGSGLLIALAIIAALAVAGVAAYLFNQRRTRPGGW